MGTLKRYKNIEDVFALYPTIATPNNKLIFTLEDGTKSPVFTSRQKATQWFNNYKKTHPTFSIVIGGTSTSKNTNKQTSKTSRTSKVSNTVETLEQKDQRYLQKYGKTEAEAKAAQQQLIEAGYLPAGADDGYWGDKSKAALAKFLEDLESGLASLTDEEREHAKSLGYVDAVKYYSSDDFLNFLNLPDNYTIWTYGKYDERPCNPKNVVAPRYLAYHKEENPLWYNSQVEKYALNQGINGIYGPLERRPDPADNVLNDLIFTALTGGAGGVKYVDEAIKATGKAARPVVQALSRATPGNLVRNVGYYAPRLQSSLNKIAPWADAAWYSYWLGNGINDMYNGFTADGGIDWGLVSQGAVESSMGIPTGLMPKYQVGMKSLTPTYTTATNASNATNAVTNTSNTAKRLEYTGDALFWGSLASAAANEEGTSTEQLDGLTAYNEETNLQFDYLPEAFATWFFGKSGLRGIRSLRNKTPYFRLYKMSSGLQDVAEQFGKSTRTADGVYSPKQAENFLKSFVIKNAKLLSVNELKAFNAFARSLGRNPHDLWQRAKTYIPNIYTGAYTTYGLGYPIWWMWNNINPGGGSTPDYGETLENELTKTNSDVPVDSVEVLDELEELDSTETNQTNPVLGDGNNNR